MIKQILQSIKKIFPKRLKSFLINLLFEHPPRYLCEVPSFSQAGEDGILRFLFLDLHINLGNVSYLDIGARHPTNGSNTFLFYINGSRGVCVEADRTATHLIKEIRPRDQVLNVAISNSNEKYGYLYFMESGGSTLDQDEANKRVNLGQAKIEEVIEVLLMDINTVIEQNFDKYPDFLSIDIEGLDLSVLKTMNFEKYPIPVICAETCSYSTNHIRPKDHSIANFLISKGYETYADTYVNTIFVNKKWFYETK